MHQAQKGALTLTNATEAGTVYGPDEVAALAARARAVGMPVHMDGARFANALVALGCTPAELTWRAGVDALSFGATKNGCLGVEAVILFDPARAWELELRRKRGGHLFSKHRYLAAQMEAYLDGRPLARAREPGQRRGDAARARARARCRASGCRTRRRPTWSSPTWPRGGHRRAKAAGAEYYLWGWGADLDGPDEEPLEARLVCNWATGEDEIAALLSAIEARGSRAARLTPLRRGVTGSMCPAPGTVTPPRRRDAARR